MSPGDERIWSRDTCKRAKSVNTKHYLLNEIDRMTEQYHKAWKNLVKQEIPKYLIT